MAEPQIQEIKANLKDLSRTDKVLAPIALLVVVGWIVTWISSGFETVRLFDDWFQTLSFFGALVVAVLVSLRLFGKQYLPHNSSRKTVAIASLLPVLGYLVEIITSLQTFLTIGGSIALAYIAATTYWRNHIPQFVTAPLGDAERAQCEGTTQATTDTENKVESESDGKDEKEEKTPQKEVAASV